MIVSWLGWFKPQTCFVLLPSVLLLVCIWFCMTSPDLVLDLLTSAHLEWNESGWDGRLIVPHWGNDSEWSRNMKRSDLPSFWQTPWNAAGCCKQRHSITECHGSLGPMFRTQAAQIRCWHIEVIEVMSMNKDEQSDVKKTPWSWSSSGSTWRAWSWGKVLRAQCHLGNAVASNTFQHIIKRFGTKNVELWAELEPSS